MINNILVATDGSEGALCAVQYAAYLAKNLGSRVTLAHVVEPAASPLPLTAISEEARRKFEEDLLDAGRAIIRLSQKPLAEAGIAANYEILEGPPAETICQYAEQNRFDLIIVGNRGRSKVSRVLLGSVSDEVIRKAYCPVMVIRQCSEDAR